MQTQTPTSTAVESQRIAETRAIAPDVLDTLLQENLAEVSNSADAAPEEVYELEQEFDVITYCIDLVDRDALKPLEQYKCPECKTSFHLERYIPPMFFCPVCGQRCSFENEPVVLKKKEPKLKATITSGKKGDFDFVLVSKMGSTKTQFEIFDETTIRYLKNADAGINTEIGARVLAQLRKQPIRKNEFTWGKMYKDNIGYPVILYRNTVVYLTNPNMVLPEIAQENLLSRIFKRAIQGEKL